VNPALHHVPCVHLIYTHVGPKSLSYTEWSCEAFQVHNCSQDTCNTEPTQTLVSEQYDGNSNNIREVSSLTGDGEKDSLPDAYYAHVFCTL
jgi:hypothetical protein